MNRSAQSRASDASEELPNGIAMNKTTLAVLLLATGLIGCEEVVSPTDPEQPEPPVSGDQIPALLVGTWQYTGNNFLEVIISNLGEYLSGEGVPDSTVAEIVQESITDEVVTTRMVLSADGSYTDLEGNSGTWEAAGDRVTLTFQGDIPVTMRYEVSADRLTLITSVASITQALTPEQGDATLAAVVTYLLKGLDDLRVYYVRVET